MPSPQVPIPSDFDRSSTAAEVIRGHDLHGRTVIVTGGSAGIGLETTRALASAGASVLVPARDVKKARAAVGTLAGIMANPLTRVARNIESQFATNHVGHFELTVRLWPALRKAEAPRIVSLTSVGHRRSPVDLEDWNFERRPYDRWKAYGQSKSANALFAIAANARGVRAFSVHPGGILTALGKFMTPEETEALVTRAGDRLKTVEQGAATTVWAAVSRQLDGLGGVYCEDCNIAQPVPADSQAAAWRATLGDGPCTRGTPVGAQRGDHRPRDRLAAASRATFVSTAVTSVEARAVEQPPRTGGRSTTVTIA